MGLECWEYIIYSPCMVICKVRLQRRIEETEQVLVVLQHNRVACLGLYCVLGPIQFV